MRQGLGRPAPSHFHHGDFVAFVDQAMRCHASAEAGADHDKVEIEFVLERHTCPMKLSAVEFRSSLARPDRAPARRGTKFREASGGWDYLQPSPLPRSAQRH